MPPIVFAFLNSLTDRSRHSGTLAPWELALVVLAGSLLVVEIVYGVLTLVFRRAHALQAARVLERTKHGARALAIAIAGTQLVSLAPRHLQPGFAELARLAVVFAAAWVAIGISGVLADLAESQFDVEVADNRRARRAVTQLKLLRRIIVVVIVVIALLAAVTSIPEARTVGASLLGAVGVIGIVFGIAGQSTLGNVVAGLQVAFSDSLRIGDVVVVEGDWGTIEEITLTFVVVKVWDLRRLVIPASYFVNNAFENWTRHDSQILGSVLMFFDYEVPVDDIREEFTRFVTEQPLWDKNVAVLQMVDTDQMAVQLRMLVSAPTAGDLWNLRCAVREHMVSYVREHYPTSLPRARLEVADPTRAGGPAASGDGTPPEAATR